MRLVTLLYSFLLSWSWTFVVILRRCFASFFPFSHASSQSFFVVWLMILDLEDLSGLWMKLASPVFDFAASFTALSAFSLPIISMCAGSGIVDQARLIPIYFFHLCWNRILCRVSLCNPSAYFSWNP